MDTDAKTVLRRAKRRDAVARWVILLGGVTVIGSVVAILALIVGVTLPLFRQAQFREAASLDLPGEQRPSEVLAVGIDRSVADGLLTAHLLTADGVCTFVDLLSQRTLGSQSMRPESADPDRKVVSVERSTGGRYSLLWSDGFLSAVEVGVGSVSEVQGQAARYKFRELAGVAGEEGAQPLKAILCRSEDGAKTTTVRLFSGGRLIAERQVTRENLLGDTEVQSEKLPLDTSGLTAITAITMDREGTTVYAGTDSGQLARWQFDDDGNIRVRDALTAFSDRRAVTSLAMMFGDASLAVGDAEGEVTTWFPVRYDGKARLTRIHTLKAHEGPVRQLAPSSRGRTLLSLAGDEIHVDHATSERHLLSIRPDSSIRSIGFSAQGNVAVALTDRELVAWEIDAPHAEVSWRTLFGPVFYEGYERPQYSWQTTGGDDFEPKLSLVPVIFGTFKGTVYSMLLAVPLALLGAIYTSHFTTPGLKRAIKPVVEIMAAVPSVVLGFLVALWLAPILEQWILAVFVGLITIPATFLGFMAAWQAVRRFQWAKSLENGYEFLILVPVLMLGVGFAALLTPGIEKFLFGGDFRGWLYEGFTLRYDQRNCVVIAFGLGFAVIPIIFSIAEDALSSVPYSLTASSLALGASRWQTLWRVILPSASPGIFAAVMIGLGRAVGETMIVLMATGNTPILDWGPFNGMRTLSANIAVEIPEAPVGGTLYRVLFLCAVLLFALTFLLNTAAELVRQRLRKRFGRL